MTDPTRLDDAAQAALIWHGLRLYWAGGASKLCLATPAPPGPCLLFSAHTGVWRAGEALMDPDGTRHVNYRPNDRPETRPVQSRLLAVDSLAAPETRVRLMMLLREAFNTEDLSVAAPRIAASARASLRLLAGRPLACTALTDVIFAAAPAAATRRRPGAHARWI